MIKLNPCVKCGGKALITSIALKRYREYVVKCPTCNELKICTVSRLPNAEDKMVELWNTANPEEDATAQHIL